MKDKPLTEEDGRRLLELARKSIKSHFHPDDLDISEYEQYDKEQGVFVTLHKDGSLRGCIGFPYPTQKLYEAVFDAARAAAFEDPRFPGLEEDELKQVNIEISVLSVPKEVTALEPEDRIKKISIGEDGLIIKSDARSGLLLPQVFTEYDCTPEEAVEMTCEKAGLKKDAWKSIGNRLYKFQAKIFRED